MNKTAFNKLHIFCNISLVLAAFISGLSFVAQKLGLNYVEPFTFNALRCFIGVISLLPVTYFFSTKQGCSIKGAILAGIVLFIAFSLNQYSMIYSDASKAGFITSLYIIFVPILAIFLKHKLNKNVLISILIALLGLYLLCAKDALQFEIWDVFLLISAFFFALHIIIIGYYSKKSDSIKLSTFQFLTAGILSLPFAIFEHPTINLILAGWRPILFIGAIVTGVAYTLQIFGQKTTKPTVATLILSSEAIFSLLGGVLILGETLNTKEIFGCLIMFFAIVFSQIPHKFQIIPIKKEAK